VPSVKATGSALDVKRFSIRATDYAPMEWYTFVVLFLLVAIGAMVSIALWLER
jgi:hypothetical protein